jgi:hypothetical protein
MNKGSTTLHDQFLACHGEHRQVYTELVGVSRRLKAKACRKIGLAGIREWLRLTMYLNHTGNTNWECRFVNDYRTRNAGLIMQQEPDLAGFFRIRELRTA